MEDESYFVLYLYSAVIEYIFFLIILIRDKGPNDLNNVAMHVKFFKKDVHTFIQNFKGSTLTEKVSQMLCSTTSVFEIKGNSLHLATNHKSFAQIIYKELLISKVADLNLRGVYTVHDICRNLNFSNLIHIEEDALVALLKRTPYFYFYNSNASVILVQFHGLVGFESHAYQTTVQYFLSFLQNIKLLTYNEIKLHSRFVPSCAVRNCLLIFCILHVSILFKFKNDKVSLRKNLKRKTRHDQVLNIEKVASKISTNSLPISMLVLEIHGPTIFNWRGEISSLTNTAGLIQCVVNFTNGHQGIFDIYFYKTALKYVCEVGNVGHFLNVRDIVEFDAEFCGETMKKDIVWQATRIKIVEHLFKENKHVLNLSTDKYIENINLNYHKLKPILKDCTERNCHVKYIKLEKDTPNNESLNRLNLSDGKEENILTYFCQASKDSQEQEVIPFNSSKILDNCCVQGIDKMEIDNNQLLNINCSDNTFDILYQIKNTNSQYPLISNLDIQLISQEINENLLNCIKESSAQNLVSDHYNAKNSGTLSYIKSPSINSIEHSSLVPNIFNDSSFILGEITFMSTCNGVAQSLQKDKLHEIFFEKNSIGFQNGATNTLKEGSQVLLFIPYADLEDSVLIATLVYPLTCEEKIMIQEKDLSAKDFVVDHYLPKMKENFSKTDFCCCDLLKSLSVVSQTDQSLKNNSEKLVNKYSQFEEQLQKLFQFNDKTYRNLSYLLNQVYAQNLHVTFVKLLKHPSFTFLRSLSWIRHSKNFSLKYMQRKKNMNKYKCSIRNYKKYKSLLKLQKKDNNNDSISTYLNENNIPKILLKPPSLDETYSVKDNCNIIELNKPDKKLAAENSVIKQFHLEKSDKKLAVENSVIKQSHLETPCDEKSSISSFVSCFDGSFNESSDDVFYSCESDSDSRPSSECNNLYKTDENRDSSNAINGIFNIVSENNFACIDAEELNEIESSGIADKISQDYTAACKYLKLRKFSSFKHIRNKCKIILPSENRFCKSCHQLPIEITAEISILRESTLYFRLKCNHQHFTLAFPQSIVPVEKSEKVKLNATIKATIIPHSLMSFSHVLYIEFI